MIPRLRYISATTSSRRAVRALMSLAIVSAALACDTEPTLDEELRPESGRVVLDLTQEDHARWFLDHAKPFYALDNARAGEMIYAEWAGERGVCIATSKSYLDFGFDYIGAYFDNPVNYYESGEPIPAREDSAETADKCDSCVGLTIPYFTPKSLKLTMASVNIAPTDDNGELLGDDNRDEIFVDRPEIREKLEVSSPGTRGFIGVMTHVPAREDGDNVVTDTDPSSDYEFVYLRPANGDSTPGAFDAGNPNTVVQYGARFYEWFVLRTGAYGEGLNQPVYEGVAKTNFGDTDVSSMVSETNTLELVLDDENTQTIRVNGELAVSSVTNEPFDRTFLGSYQPNRSEGTTNVIFVGRGVYGCFQQIEMDL